MASARVKEWLAFALFLASLAGFLVALERFGRELLRAIPAPVAHAAAVALLAMASFLGWQAWRPSPWYPISRRPNLLAAAITGATGLALVLALGSANP